MTRLLTILFFLLSISACADDGDQAYSAQTVQAENEKITNTMDIFFNKTDTFLSANIAEGKVPYKDIKNNPAKLNELVKMIGNVSLDDVSDVQEKAFYINAYNILTIHSIINNGIPASPMDVDGFFDGIKHKVAGIKLTLDGLEKETLFPQFPDARIHFAVVCAALGCPQIQPFAYVPEKLDKQLTEVTKENLNRDYFTRVNGGNETVEISELFKWYKKDFLKDADSVLAYINQYRDEKIPSHYSVSHYEYDWSLNSK